MRRSAVAGLCLGMLGLVVASTAAGQTATATDAKVQAPTLSAPERGSIVGQLAKTVFGSGDLARGLYSLPGPFTAPSERGPLQADVFPGYAAEQPLSEWGLGWGTSLSMRRFRIGGEVDFATDGLSGPFGNLLQGADGYWYPLGLSKTVRVVWSGDVITAHLADGTVMTFGGAGHILAVGGKGTFEWYLASVESITGRRTKLDYVANASGRPFLSSVWYGGVGDDFQHRVDFTYETLSTPFRDYASGKAVDIDRRVSQVTAFSKHAITGAFGERWHYEVSYASDGLGPAFYLTGVQQVFASGERPPASSYTYRFAREDLAASAFVFDAKVDSVARVLQANVIQPDRSSITDLDQDGMLDVERASDQVIAHQTETGWSLETLPWGPGTTAACRQPTNDFNEPRTLATLRAADEGVMVASFVYDPGTMITTFSACSRGGAVVGSQRLANNWSLGDHTKLVDLNRDRQPDLIRVLAGAYQIRPNTSTGTAYSFGGTKSGVLYPYFTPEGVWVQDFNGDGIPDIVARSASALIIWYGKGHLEFEPVGRAIAFSTLNGALVLTEHVLSFVDANKDGLADVLLTNVSSNTTHLFVNRGADFVGARVAGLSTVGLNASKPIVADLSGSGNTELVYTVLGRGYSVTLDSPATSLMEKADDGKGTVLSFEYGRARPAAGVDKRQTVLTAMTVSSVGYDDKRYVFDYQSPHVHGVGKFFLGFDGVTRTDSLGTESASFLNEDRYSGVFLGSRRHDAKVASVDGFETRTYEEAVFQGIAWKRPKQTLSGVIDASGASTTEETSVDSYLADFCPEVTTQRSTAGMLTRTKQYMDLPRFGLAMSCIWGDTVEVGKHQRSQFDFRHETVVTRNDVGLVQEVASLDGTSRWVLQDVSYRPTDWQVESVSSPGKGTSHFSYDSVTRALSSVVTPDGVELVADQRDPLTDAILALRTSRGAPSSRQYFRFDGLERLAKQWDDFGGSSEASPITQYGYKYAKSGQPAAITQVQLIDAARSSVRTSVELQTAAGEAITSATRLPEGWTLTGLVARSRVTAEQWQYEAPTVPATKDPLSMVYPDFFAGAEPVGYQSESSMGFAVETRTTYHVGVERRLTRALALSGGLMALTETENGANSTTTWMDSGKRVVGFDDEDGKHFQYAYDALGRLREVVLPNGKAHRAWYDGHGRRRRVERDGVASVEDVFDATSGLPTERRYFTHAEARPANALVRTVRFTYDAIGRVTQEKHVDAIGGGTKVFTSYYDGATPSAPSARTTLGLQSAVAGDGFSKTFEYRPDGKILRRVVQLGSWRSVETMWNYLEGGVAGGQRVRVFDGAGQLLVSTAQTELYDAYGRVQFLTLNGPTLASYLYDVNGQLHSVSFANGDTVSFWYDGLTRQRKGSAQSTLGYQASTERWMNNRGMVDRERFLVGSTDLMRAYVPSRRRQLRSATDTQDTYGYDYDDVGLPVSYSRGGETKYGSETSASLSVGTVTYGFDGLHRTVSRTDATAPGDALVLAYGPDGQVATATRGGATFSYLHDETGQRLMKSGAGGPVAAYLDEGYLDESGLTGRVSVGGRTVGVLRNGVFQTVATDLRGSVVAETTGEARLASPFGQRDVHTALSAAIEYVEKGYDADLGFVRMGARDYDPETNRFTTADPLFLGSPDKCVGAPSQCNLYGYAGGDPVSHVDPSGYGFLDDASKVWNSVEQGWNDLVARASSWAGGKTSAPPSAREVNPSAACGIW